MRQSTSANFFLLVTTILTMGCTVPGMHHDNASATPTPPDLFNTGYWSGEGSQPSTYDPHRLNDFYTKRRETEFQMFDLINEAAVRHDLTLKPLLDLHSKDLGYIPSLAAAHYRWAFGDKTQLAWLLAEERKHGIGRDSLILTVFGYMDEWDKTIRCLKENDEYDNKHGNAAAGETVMYAIAVRKYLYGEEKFKRAWDAVKTH